MKSIQYIQRFNLPQGTLDQPLSVPSGFNKKIREILGQVVQLDYMGSAEFQWDAIPNAFQALEANKRKLRADSMEICIFAHKYESEDIQRAVVRYREYVADQESKIHFEDDLAAAEKIKAYIDNPQPLPIYIIAPGNDIGAIKKFIDKDAIEPQWLAERTHFRQSFIDPSKADTVGWFDIENGFMYFKDWKMFDRMAQLFDVKHSIPNPDADPKPSTPGAQATTPAQLRI